MRGAVVAIIGGLALAPRAWAAEPWEQQIATGLGKSGVSMQGGIYRIAFPRTDLHVTLDGVEIQPSLALGSWLAFKRMGSEVIVMGDLVLTDREVNPVLQHLEERGMEVTALHNHLLRSSPTTMYMHVHGHGGAPEVSQALREALAASATPFEAAGSPQPPAPASTVQRIDLDTAALDQILGRKGRVAGGVYQVSVPRADPVKEGEIEISEAMGSAIAISFQPLGQGSAAITGDFVLTADEVNPVIKALRANSIDVTAIHNHMLDETPRLFFMHFWAHDDAEKLAKGLRAALDQVKTANR